MIMLGSNIIIHEFDIKERFLNKTEKVVLQLLFQIIFSCDD
jgi:hypothetical protein